MPGGPARIDALSLTTGWTVVRGRLIDPSMYARQTAHELTSRRACGENAYDRKGFKRVHVLDNAVQTWLAPLPPGSPYTSGIDEKLVSRIEAMGDEERRVWLGRYFATLDSCAPGEVPFP